MNHLGSFEPGTRDAHSQSPAILVVAGARRFRALPSLSAELNSLPSNHWSEIPKVRKSESPKVRKSESPKVRKSESPKVRKSESPKVHIEHWANGGATSLSTTWCEFVQSLLARTSEHGRRISVDGSRVAANLADSVRSEIRDPKSESRVPSTEYRVPSTEYLYEPGHR
jgi:hypothetical protein